MCCLSLQCDYVWRARVEWEKRLRFELRAVATKQHRKLVELRDSAAALSASASAAAIGAAAGSSASATAKPADSGIGSAGAADADADAEFAVRFVYTAEDLLDVLTSLRNPNQSPAAAAAPGNSATTASATAKSAAMKSSGATSAAAPSNAAAPPLLAWGLLQHLCLPAPRLSRLVERYGSLAPTVRQLGVDDAVLGGEWFVADRTRVGEELLAAHSAAALSAAAPSPTAGGHDASAAALASATDALRRFARTGVPSALRPAFWARLLGVSLPLSSGDAASYQSLLSSVRRWRLLTDDLVRFDVADGPGDDEGYFVFEDQLHEVMAAFARDPSVRERTSLLANSAPILAKPNTNTKKRITDKQTAAATAMAAAANKRRSADASALAAAGSAAAAAAGPTAAAAVSAPAAAELDALLFPDSVPPSRIVPFHRLVYLLTPLCFVYSSSAHMYFVFRALYCRWLSRLSTVSSAADSILTLAHGFESLLQRRAPALCFKLRSLGISSPLQCGGSFSWLCSAFSGFLDVEQVLLLWDRVLAFDSLDLLAVLAAAIFTWREARIMAARTAAEVQDVMRELANIKVVPLLQHFLFGPAARAAPPAHA